MNFLRFRVDSLGSPFRNVDSGRATEADWLNNTRMAEATINYLNQFLGKHQRGGKARPITL